MTLATLTSKGQVVIPHKIRKILNLQAGEKLDFRVDDKNEIHVVPVHKAVDEVFGFLKDKTRVSLSINDISLKLKQAFRERKI